MRSQESTSTSVVEERPRDLAAASRPASWAGVGEAQSTLSSGNLSWSTGVMEGQRQHGGIYQGGHSAHQIPSAWWTAWWWNVWVNPRWEMSEMNVAVRRRVILIYLLDWTEASVLHNTQKTGSHRRHPFSKIRNRKKTGSVQIIYQKTNLTYPWTLMLNIFSSSQNSVQWAFLSLLLSDISSGSFWDDMRDVGKG